ncbi:MAG: FecR family protein [Pedobacter sp.]|nr:FecR family protein [Pedobacter sp.]
MQKKNAQDLLQNYAAGLCNEEEKAIIEGWYLCMPEDGRYPDHHEIENSKSEVWKSLPLNKAKVIRLNFIRNLSIAATFLICLGTAFYFYISKTNAGLPQNTIHDIAPGGNKATLILADGKKIALDDTSTGKIAEQSGLIVTKTADGQLLFQIKEVKSINPLAYNSIITPKGGQYQVQLPDGTKVWLNTASSLKFPTAFAAKERSVILNGEAYFEVAKNPERPFMVNTPEQKVVVLGTHFNINSYPDEQGTKTTLFEGVVKVIPNRLLSSKILKPGEQSILKEDKLHVEVVDMEEILAWKNGLFVFNNESLESIMRKISRWYNVDIEYAADAIKSEPFGGSISRFGNVSQILHMLEITGHVRFKILPNRILVMNK